MAWVFSLMMELIRLPRLCLFSSSLVCQGDSIDSQFFARNFYVIFFTGLINIASACLTSSEVIGSNVEKDHLATYATNQATLFEKVHSEGLTVESNL
ncbi:hypothetical protein BDP81DRAFT_420836 [Colletotrichum phormii]|uniref:Uncharacterized protein n=1 Tax=Colletotrichum phormii TaxID=359342 RepID=A0AAI9ZW83_9PEZI|nr:uncharacterized protein BDP81DRAFT_420836 [Colletotrichum phormii]KAK1639365.1 hypothetical protein BDP81DRAFT_420836 [Colletotrichum phormii]